MHISKSLLTLTSVLYSTLAADCGGGRFGGVTSDEVHANSMQIYNTYLDTGVIDFAPNAPAVSFQTGECVTAIRHDQTASPGTVDVSELFVAIDNIDQTCVIPNQAPGGRGQGGEVTGIAGRGASDGTFTVTIYQGLVTSRMAAKMRKF
ncbi:MAG: hypothetical protein Q9179_003079 [Wetmoreana sp. 5 TL-2023]